MGRDEKRFRERAATKLRKQLQREPSEAEIEQEVTRLREAQGFDAHQRRAFGRKGNTPQSMRLR